MAGLRKVIPLAAIILLVVLVLPATTLHQAEAIVYPDDVWVAPPPLGDNGNAGTETAPFATIQWGIDHVNSDNGTVHVAAGTYLENLVISGTQNLEGAGAQNTIIDGNGWTSVIRIGSAPESPNTISGFTIQNGYVISSIWNPTNAKVLYAGFKLPFREVSPNPFDLVLGGGGIYIGDTHIVTINDCVIKNNQAEVGGGILNEGQLYMNRCTVSNNSALIAGGGIYNTPGGVGESGQMWLTNCTISGNQVTLTGGEGGGIYNEYDMTLLNVTIANNTATGSSSRGGGFANLPGNLTAFFKNCIVANNHAVTAGTDNGYTKNPTDTVSQGHNLSSDNSCGFDQPTDLINTDPLLGPLQDNGGPTPTQALLHGSPAIDKGGDPYAIVTDQRGVPRPQGSAFDIGAYELAQASVSTSTNEGTAYFSTLNGYITDLSALNPEQTSCGSLPDFNFPFGLFSFNVTDITPGSTATVVLILPTNAPPNTQYWKCLNGHWVDCTSLLGSNDGDSVLTLSITDGQPGDGDGQANGQISDPGGPVMMVAPAPTHPSVSPPLPRLLNPPQMSVQYLSVSPKQATANQPVTIATNVVNTGDQGGNLNIALKINGQVEQTRMVSVGPKASQPVKFTVTKSEPGTYDVAILDQNSSFTILGKNNAAGTPVNNGLINFLIITALLIATAAALILSRRPA
jgi:hypothetical protein